MLRGSALIRTIYSVSKGIIRTILCPNGGNLRTRNLSLSTSTPYTILVERRTKRVIISIASTYVGTTLGKVQVILGKERVGMPVPREVFYKGPKMVHISEVAGR